jgi:hypothetical protein
MDCDIYSSTKYVLEALSPHFCVGTVIVFDGEYSVYRSNPPPVAAHLSLSFPRDLLLRGCL